jgi:hypothetical protein
MLALNYVKLSLHIDVGMIIVAMKFLMTYCTTNFETNASFWDLSFVLELHMLFFSKVDHSFSSDH